ncbi:hypothetical protein K1T71_009938 [Dendrolimus kikuchii]|uniref:Uncharacterized protein n=1 Tax=Dendrolimus kikuchii TaxID=765133 RepID=A0ACC1CTS7_9NEOP|nr:hypothetical protein K1T71_009938 [Dendrolimus kikuchii]
MASTNYLTVKSHLTEIKSFADRDNLSEASESGASNSTTSAEDLQKLAVILGLNSVEDVYQEKFRVDRRRLEAMLADTLEESKTAQAFFNRIMTETNTLINWPTRIKIGARSKKDPHVRVAGRPDDVRLAREKIMRLLDTRSNRVTMKIDVSYTDHSHIIGKGGLTIKRVMEETGCHIHFPDSNRTSTQEKSNQVSIAGDMQRVERARARVRALTPLVFCFELPIVSASQPLPDLSSSYIVKIQHQYNVQVMVRNRPKLHSSWFTVKGVQWNVQGTMEATNLLMNYMCGSLASQTTVQMTLEITPSLHSVVAGSGAEHLKAIMKSTQTQIMFPDAQDPNVPNLRKSCVVITGQIADVYAARQQLMGCLPLVVIFDIPEIACRMENDAVKKLSEKHNVFINIRRKPKQGIASVIMKTVERCASDLYEARREFLGGKEPVVFAEIPESYNINAFSGLKVPNFNIFSPFSPTHNNMMNSPCSPYNMQIDVANYGNGSPMFGQHPQTPVGFPSPHSPIALTPPMWILPSPQPGHSPFNYPGIGPNPIVYKNLAGNWSPMTNVGDMGMPQPMPLQPPYPMQVDARPTTLSQLFNCSSQASSGYQSNFTGSCVSLDVQNTSGNYIITGAESSNVASPSMSPISKAHSPTASTDADRSQELANIISDIPLSERRAVGCEKKTLDTLSKLSPLSEFRRMKAEAAKAMREDISGGYRVPTPRWSGYYFSHTSPGPINMHDNDPNTTPEKVWNKSELIRPNILEKPDSPPQISQTQTKPCRYQQLYTLLNKVGLYKYIDLFKQHEVDICTFASLTDDDLASLGVSAFGARRKMMMVIAELQKQSSSRVETPQPSTSSDHYAINSPPEYNLSSLPQDKW